jgi:hypothetical protein
MRVSSYQQKIVLLDTGFRYPDRPLLFARARLYLDRIELSGWDIGSRYHVDVPLEHIRHVEWRSLATDEPNVVLHLDGRSSVVLIVRKAHLWRHMLEERLRWIPRGARAGAAHVPLDLPLKELVSYAISMS